MSGINKSKINFETLLDKAVPALQRARAFALPGSRVDIQSVLTEIDAAYKAAEFADDRCDRCGGPAPDGGDGYDGLCADCADKNENKARETATILAALRFWQRSGLGAENTDIVNGMPLHQTDIATGEGGFCALDFHEIDDLCERINQ